MFDSLSLLSINLLSLAIPCLYAKNQTLTAKHLLPHPGAFLQEKKFADFFLGWNEEGLSCKVEVEAPFIESNPKKAQEGDALLLLVDTRDVKSASYPTPFCHQFTLFADKENAHQIPVESTFRSSSYTMAFFLPQELLHGYDPELCDHIGFSYVLYRKRGTPQHFSCSSEEYTVALAPSLWASLFLQGGA